ncbi:AsnC family transcriptional regulator [Paracidovorax citrulli]
MAAILRASVLIDAGDVFGAIEWILATARRTGLALQSMVLDEGDTQAPMRQLDLKANAGTAELLDLFLHRLRNGVDVRGVQVHGREPSSVTAGRHC